MRLLHDVVIVCGAITTLFAYLTWFCACADAIFPQPKPGSRWVKLRRLISIQAINVGAAVNRILPGTLDATVTNLDVLRRVEESHAEAQAARVNITAAVEQVPGKLTDLTGRVNNLGQMIVQKREPAK